MRSITVCVGSSCHLKGSHDVITEFKRLIAKHHLEEQVELKGCFCLGECKDGVSIRVDDQLFISITKERVDSFFREHFLSEDGHGM